MTHKVKATFGKGVTMEDLGRVMQRMGVGPDKPAPGMIAHEDTIEDGCIVFVEEWETKTVYESFINEVAIPAFEAEGVPVANVIVLD